MQLVFYKHRNLEKVANQKYFTHLLMEGVDQKSDKMWLGVRLLSPISCNIYNLLLTLLSAPLLQLFFQSIETLSMMIIKALFIVYRKYQDINSALTTSLKEQLTRIREGKQQLLLYCWKFSRVQIFGEIYFRECIGIEPCDVIRLDRHRGRVDIAQLCYDFDTGRTYL